MDIRGMRRDYQGEALDEAASAADPLEQFRAWFEAASASDILDPNAMTLATVGADGRPSSRIVLLKEVDDQGLVFFTSYTSRKGRELAANPQAALLFHWPQLERQVRVEGGVEQVPAQVSDDYFAVRPVASQLEAWASPQSEPIDSREVLEANQRAAAERFGDQVPRPPQWGGYRLVPELVEFWQGRPSRLHDRLRYQLVDGAWQRDRLAP